MQVNSFQQNSIINHSKDSFQIHEKQKAKPQRRKLMQKVQEIKVRRPSIRLNLKKLPKDWFTPRKSVEKSTSRQTIQTERYIDSLPSDNPEIKYSSQRLIFEDDELQRTSHFGESIQSPSMKKNLAQNNDSFFKDQQNNQAVLGVESLPHISDRNDQKFDLKSNKKQFSINLKNVQTEQRSQQLDLTFSNPPNRRKSFSVKKVVKKPLQQKIQQKITEFQIEPQKQDIHRKISEDAVSIPKNSQSFSELKRKIRLFSKQKKHRIVPDSLQNTVEMKRTMTKFYFRKNVENKETEQLFGKINELHLPPLARLSKH